MPSFHPSSERYVARYVGARRVVGAERRTLSLKGHDAGVGLVEEQLHRQLPQLLQVPSA